MPPGAPMNAGPPAACVSVEPKLETLRKRAEFLACSRAMKAPAPAFLLQARRRAADEGDAERIRVGFTASKKIGNSVLRNRAKRRLRALARSVIAREGRPGWDYVLVARRDETVSRPFAHMEAELLRALERIHTTRKPS